MSEIIEILLAAVTAVQTMNIVLIGYLLKRTDRHDVEISKLKLGN